MPWDYQSDSWTIWKIRTEWKGFIYFRNCVNVQISDSRNSLQNQYTYDYFITSLAFFENLSANIIPQVSQIVHENNQRGVYILANSNHVQGSIKENSEAV